MKHRGFLYAYGVASAHTTVILKGILRSFAIIFMGLTNAKIGRNFEMTKFLHIEILRAPLPSYLLHLTSYIFLLTSFRTSPVPFNLEGAPPLSCILPPQGEENRSACRSYIMVSADHQRSGFYFALRQKGKVEGRWLKAEGRRLKAEG